MSWLFGKKKEEKKKADPEMAMKAINTQIDNISKRQMVLDKKSKDLTQEALKSKKSKNTRAAVLALKKRKLVDQEMNKIDGMKMLMEQQKLELEGTLPLLYPRRSRLQWRYIRSFKKGRRSHRHSERGGEH